MEILICRTLNVYMLFTFYDVSHELTCIPSTVYICVFTENVRICALNEKNNNNNNKLTSIYTNIYGKWWLRRSRNMKYLVF